MGSPLRVGWLVEPGFGPIDRETTVTVEAAAEALRNLGHSVENVHIPALERDFGFDVFSRLHVLEMKPRVAEITAGHRPDEIGDMARFMLGLPDTSATDYIDAVRGAERLRDGYAAYFAQYDILLTPVLPVHAFRHGQTELTINGQILSVMGIMNVTSHLNVTGLPGVVLRFGTSSEGMPIGVQVVGRWGAEPTILRIASLLEQVSPSRGLHPQLY